MIVASGTLLTAAADVEAPLVLCGVNIPKSMPLSLSVSLTHLEMVSLEALP